MKKLLLASTALVATAGVAAAEVALTGQAEMGIFNPNTDSSELQFFTDLDIRFTMTGETDGGISFGATIDIDEVTDTGSGDVEFEDPEDQGGEAIFVSFGGATLTMGDTDGAVDAAMPEMALAGGSLNDDETAHLGFDDQDGLFDDFLGTGLADDSGLSLDGAGDGQVARFDYTFSSFVFSLSLEQLNNGDDIDIDGEDVSTVYGLGVAYAGDFNGVAVEAGLGYQEIREFANVLGIAGTASLANGFSFGATASRVDFDDADFSITSTSDVADPVTGIVDEVETITTLSVDGDENLNHYGVGIGYEMNNLAVGLNYGKYEYDDFEQSGYGLAATYDLGGGLSFRVGASSNESDAQDDFNSYSMGLRMNF